MVRVQSALEYLDSATDVLRTLRDYIIPIIGDASTIKELRKLSVSPDGVEDSLRKFADIVLSGSLTIQLQVGQLRTGQ